jgi:hypothetical protein
LAPNDELRPFDVDVVPAKTNRLAATQTCHRDHFIQRAEPVHRDIIEEPTKLCRLPGMNPHPARRRQFYMQGRVDGEALLFHRSVQGHPQSRMDTAHRRRPDRLPTRHIACFDRLIHRRDVVSAKKLQRHLAKVRNKIRRDVTAIIASRPHPKRSFCLKPRHKPRLHSPLVVNIESCGQPATHAFEGLFGGRLGGEPAALELPSVAVFSRRQLGHEVPRTVAATTHAWTFRAELASCQRIAATTPSVGPTTHVRPSAALATP